MSELPRADDWKARAEAAEAKLARIRAAIEPLRLDVWTEDGERYAEPHNSLYFDTDFLPALVAALTGDNE